MNSFKVEMRYNDKIMKDFYKFHYSTISNITFALGIAMLIAGIICLFFNWISGLLLCVLAIGVAYTPQAIIMSSLNANKRMLNAEDSFIFSQDGVQVHSEILGEVKINEKYDYSQFISVKDYKDYLYLYMTKTSAIIIEKSKITKRQADFIKKTILKNIPQK